MLRLSLRTKILSAVLAGVIATDALGTWAVNYRLVAGAQQEADQQARAQLAQVQAVYAERAATLAAEGEAVSLYPAVIAALVAANTAPLLQWSSQVAALQGIDVTVVNASGRVIARGHAPDQAGDDVASRLSGMRLALAGQSASGTEAGDEIGLAIRGFAPVRQNGREGPVVGAVMIAEPFGPTLLSRLNSPSRTGSPSSLTLTETATGTETCTITGEVTTATCGFPLLTPDSQVAGSLSLSVPLAEIDAALTDAQRALWLVGVLVLLVGAVVAWVLARSLTSPLSRLTSAADEIASGAYNRALEVRGHDEIGVLARAFETMRQRVAAATARLRDERDVLDAVLESTGDGVLMVDRRGNEVVANRRWTEMFGRAGLLAAAALRRLESGDQQTLGEIAPAWLADPDRVAVAEFERAEPRYDRFRCYSGPVKHVDGSTLGRLFVMRNVTRESEAERMRSAFVATVSHELRSPLTAIAGYTDTLLTAGPWDGPTEREFLEIIAQSATKLAGLVDNLLDAAKVEAGVLQLEREPVRVKRIAEEVVAHRSKLAGNHSLRLEVESDLPLAEADPVRVEQIITNLVDNAIKYSPDGGQVTVSVGGTADVIRIGVTDRGIGITSEQADRLFERFYRADSSLRRTTRGVGLGLFICRSLVEAHGGRIWVESEPGSGSTFWFTLPALNEAPELASTTSGGRPEVAV
jgi:signal transduction histidine kinase